MLEDKRIKKTKKYLKQTLMDLLTQKTFDQITVKEICDKSEISRVTFYTHYNDKYDLVEDIAKDMIKIAKDEYYRLQEKNNPTKDYIVGYCNLLDCILTMYYENINFFSHTNVNENPYLNFAFYKYVLDHVKTHAQKKSVALKLKYDAKKIAGFLCYGVWGFINEKGPNETMSDLRRELREILEGILRAEILTKNILPEKN